MYTLGHTFIPEPIHAGGLRYHGAGVLVSQLLKDKLIEAQSFHQLECFDAGVKFARSEGIIPAPESTHAIMCAIKEALKADEEGTSKTILFNLSGHGYFDMSAYDAYFSGKLVEHHLTEEELYSDLRKLETPVIE
jgi:tryptophan synthase beta chain